AIEIQPDANTHIHHILTYTQPASQPLNPNNALKPTSINGVTPNKPNVVYPNSVDRILRSNSNIVLQMHYTTNGTPTTDQTRVDVIFAKQPPVKMAAGGMVLQPRFVIAANDPNAEVKGSLTLPRDIVMTTLTPHM